MANALQSLNMVYSFAAQGVETYFSPGNRTGQKNLQAELEKKYGLFPEKNLHFHFLSGRHKGLYGLRFRLNLAYRWLSASEGTVFFARDIKEWLTILRLKKRINRPFFMEMHEVLADEHAREGTGKADDYRRLEQQIINISDGIIATTKPLARRVNELFNPKVPVLVAPNGYNEDIFRPQPAVDLSGKISLLYFGSFHPGKGVHALLEAMSFLPEKFTLTLLGGSPIERVSRLKDQYEHEQGRVEFVGAVSPSNIGKYLEKSQMIVIPQSSDEFFSPIKLSEAMGAGLPTVVTPLFPLTSRVTHGKEVYVAEGKGAEEIAKAILRVADNVDLAHSLQAGMQLKSQGQTWKDRAAACVEFINDNMSS